jgi:hypothetical protein
LVITKANADPFLTNKKPLSSSVRLKSGRAPEGKLLLALVHCEAILPVLALSGNRQVFPVFFVWSKPVLIHPPPDHPGLFETGRSAFSRT